MALASPPTPGVKLFCASLGGEPDQAERGGIAPPEGEVEALGFGILSFPDHNLPLPLSIPFSWCHRLIYSPYEDFTCPPPLPPHRTAPEKGEEKRTSGNRLCYLKLSRTSLTKCYFGMNTRCQFTSVRGTAAAATSVPTTTSRRRRVSASTWPRRHRCFSPSSGFPGTCLNPPWRSLPRQRRLQRSLRRRDRGYNLPAVPGGEKKTSDARLPRSCSDAGI